MFRAVAVVSLALLPAYGGAVAQGRSVNAAQDAGAWMIGPIIRGRNHSRGMPPTPAPTRNGGFAINLPQAPGSVHYVTFRHGPLTGKRRIVMTYRVDADPGVRIAPRTSPASPSQLTLYFQQAGDNWSARGPFETYRWYATFATQMPITPGVHRIVASLGANWTAVQTSSARTNPAGFREALANADQVGFVLGGGDGYGHGVFATGRARLVVTDFRVE